MLTHDQELEVLMSKIKDLEEFSKESGFNLEHEIKLLKTKEKELREQIYSNLSSWERVQLARFKERPGTADYLKMIFTDFIEFHGDRAFQDDLSIVGGIARFEGIPVTVVGHRKGKDTKENLKFNFGMPHPEGYRKALRLMKQAEKFGRPVITFIDTPGAYCGIGAEERGQGESIARNLTEMAGLQVPFIAVLIGEGGSGGALALGVADRFLMLENAVFSVISPEGCASILFKDAAKAKEAAQALKITAGELNEMQLVDKIIPEPLGGAHRDPEATAQNIKASLREILAGLKSLSKEELLNARRQKYRAMGSLG